MFEISGVSQSVGLCKGSLAVTLVTAPLAGVGVAVHVEMFASPVPLVVIVPTFVVGAILEQNLHILLTQLQLTLRKSSFNYLDSISAHHSSSFRQFIIPVTSVQPVCRFDPADTSAKPLSLPELSLIHISIFKTYLPPASHLIAIELPVVDTHRAFEGVLQLMQAVSHKGFEMR